MTSCHGAQKRPEGRDGSGKDSDVDFDVCPYAGWNV